jgi:hypothetical protein
MGLIAGILSPETIAAYIVLSFAAAFLGRHRRIGFWGFFFLSLLATPFATLFFIFVWELVADFPGYLPRLTITGWLRSIVTHHPPAGGFLQAFSQALPVGLSLVVLCLLAVIFLALALRIFSRRDYVLEQ